MNFETIPAKSLDGYIGRPDCMIIDLRDWEEYCQGHIKGAVCVPFEQFQKSVPLRKNVRYVLYCERGSARLPNGWPVWGIRPARSSAAFCPTGGGIWCSAGKENEIDIDSGRMAELILGISEKKPEYRENMERIQKIWIGWNLRRPVISDWKPF